MFGLLDDEDVGVMGKDGGVFGAEGGLGVLGDEGHGGSYLGWRDGKSGKSIVHK